MAELKEIKALTGFRGAAALIVAVYHFCKAVGEDAPFAIHGGYIAVDAFFILSGYVLAYNYAYRFLPGTSFDVYSTFIIKRIARIYPAFLGILALTTLKAFFDFSGSSGLSDLGWWDVIGNLLMLTGWGLHVTPIMGVSWSVSAELFCYLLFPVIVLLLLLPASTRAACAVAFFAMIAYLSLFVGGAGGALDIVAWDNIYPLIRALSGFGMGVIAYSAKDTVKSIAPQVLDFVLVVSLFALVAIWSFDHTDLGKYLIISLIVFIAAQDTHAGVAIFGNRPIVFAGDISYSLYLIHPLLVGAGVRLIGKAAPVLGDNLAFFGALVFYLAIGIVLSVVSYKIFELWSKNALLSLMLRRSVKT